MYSQFSIMVKKIFVLMLFLGFTSCASKVKTTDEDKEIYEIINSELKLLYPKSNGETVFLKQELRNKITDLDDLAFDEGYEFHYLTTFYSLSKEEFQYLFNKKQMEDYKKQLKVKRLILPSKIELKNVTVVDSMELNNNKNTMRRNA